MTKITIGAIRHKRTKAGRSGGLPEGVWGAAKLANEKKGHWVVGLAQGRSPLARLNSSFERRKSKAE